MKVQTMFLLTWLIPLLSCKSTTDSGYSEVHSDHIDGPATTEHAISDLVDLYAFRAPENPKMVTLALGTYPFSLRHNHFSDKVHYRFYLRQVRRKSHGSNPPIQSIPSSEKIIECRFDTPGDHTNHTMQCQVEGFASAKVRFNEVSQERTGKLGLRLYHGLRGDPFFVNTKVATALVLEGVHLDPIDKNTISRTNVLSIVVQFDPQVLFGKDASLIGVVAQSFTTRESGKKMVPLDRVGRGEVTNFLLAARGKEKLRDDYNVERPFFVAWSRRERYRQRFIESINIFDPADKKIDFTSQAAKVALADLLMEDYLLFDVSRPESGRTGFLGIESQLRQGLTPSVFGGRRLKDDLVDEVLGLMVTNGKQPIRDGVDRPTGEVSDVFPYLPEPDTSKKGWINTYFAKAKSGSGGGIVKQILKIIGLGSEDPRQAQ